MNADPGKYKEQDSILDTNPASSSEQARAWHEARDDFRRDYGDLDKRLNRKGYEDAFGPVAGQNEDRDW